MPKEKMKRSSLLLFIVLCVGIFTIAARTQNQKAPSNDNNLIAIVGATVVDGTGTQPQRNTVIIRGDRIETVAPKVEIPAGAKIINAEGLTLMPGIFDLHTHLPYSSISGATSDWGKNLKAYLYCGVTSVVDFGTYPETFEPMRRLIRNGVIEAPRISLAARISTPGGHGAEGGRGDFFSIEVTTPREAQAAIRRVLPYQPDVIKAFTDGWRYGAAPDLTSMNEETLTALVAEAHKNGLEVLTHTVSLDKAKIAARSGVDVIDHGTGDKDVDEELIQLMKTKGTTYAPTLAVYEPRGRDILTPLLAAVLTPSAREVMNPPLIAPQNPPLKPAAGSAENGDSARRLRWVTLQRNTAALRKGGITFGAGTDAGVTGTHHGWATLRELQLLVAGGLTPMEAITAATSNAARALKVDNERGTIAPGKLADLILIEGEPHKNIQILADAEKIKHVFLGGRELDREKLAREIASPALTAIPSTKAQELVDDFESANGRSALDTLWINSSDAGADSSKMLFGRIARDSGNHALSISTRMAEKDRPFARINVPLNKGAVEPADVREFRGVKFDVRGDGEYRLLTPTYYSGIFQTSFNAVPIWKTVNIEFSALKPGNARGNGIWRGDDVLMLSFEMARGAGSFGWLEIDNVRFYR